MGPGELTGKSNHLSFGRQLVVATSVSFVNAATWDFT